MFLNVDVRQFRAILQFLPEIASHPCSNTLSCKRETLTVKRAIVWKPVRRICVLTHVPVLEGKQHFSIQYYFNSIL